jgi:hypothetical protein
MDRNKIIEELKLYFTTDELVSEVDYLTYQNKDDIWNLFTIEILATLLFLRKSINKPFTINDWSYSKNKKKYNWRGYRSDKCTEGAKQSQHRFGNAFDIIIKGMTADEARKCIVSIKDELPYPIRMESGVSWLHIDGANKSKNKVYIFKP